MTMMSVHDGRIQQSAISPYQVAQGFRPSRLTTAAGVAKQLRHNRVGSDAVFYGATSQDVAADGDIFYFYAYLRGTETKLLLNTLQDTNCGKFDLYVNGVLHTSGFDWYNNPALPTGSNYITIQTRPGHNEFKFVVNGKNALSSSYYLNFLGISVA